MKDKKKWKIQDTFLNKRKIKEAFRAQVYLFLAGLCCCLCKVRSKRAIRKISSSSSICLFDPDSNHPFLTTMAADFMTRFFCVCDYCHICIWQNSEPCSISMFFSSSIFRLIFSALDNLILVKSLRDQFCLTSDFYGPLEKVSNNIWEEVIYRDC